MAVRPMPSFEAENPHPKGVSMSDHAGRASRLESVLAELVSQAPEIEAAAVVSFDGLPMAAALPPTMDEDRVAAMSAALLSLGERAAEGLGRGHLSQVYIEGASGTVFLVSADGEAVLVAVAEHGAKAGMMLFEVRRAAARLADVLRGEDVNAAAPAPLESAVPTQPGAYQPMPAYEPLPEAGTYPAPYQPSASWSSYGDAQPTTWS